MSPIQVPDHYNYVGVFLMLTCNLSCDYCINHLSGPAKKKKNLQTEQWIRLLNRLDLPPGLPITLQGGEPSLHPGFIQIINELRPDIPVDVLTNLQFDVEKFANTISPSRLRRNAPYANIRVSYHPTTMSWRETLKKVRYLHDRDFSISLNSVLHPDQEGHLNECRNEAAALGLDFRFKEFLGQHEGKTYGTYLYQDACFSQQTKSCLCKTSELLISPDGENYRCHHDLYNSIEPQGSMLSEDFRINSDYQACNYFGRCNPCDVKVKNNRFQEFGHTSVSILFPGEDKPLGVAK